MAELTLVEALKGSAPESFVKMVRLELQDIRNRFFSIGFRLYEAQRFKYYEELGYETIEALAEAEFGFKRSTTYGLISVFRCFCVRDSYGNVRNELAAEYRAYSYSQLLEIQKLNPYFRRSIPSSASVRSISEFGRYVSKNPGEFYSYETWKNATDAKKATLKLIESSEQTALDLSKMTEIEEEDPAPSVFSEYRFDVRDGVRKFLNDYFSWLDLGYASHGQKQYKYVFANGMSLWALEVKTYPNKNDLTFIRRIVTYYLDKDDKEGPVRLSKRAIELFCMENHAKLRGEE